MELIYKIDSTNDREGNIKEIPTEWKEQEYFIHSAGVGRSAILLWSDGTDRHLRTSKVEEILILGNSIKLTTMNTVYYLKPVIKGE